MRRIRSSEKLDAGVDVDVAEVVGADASAVAVVFAAEDLQVAVEDSHNDP